VDAVALPPPLRLRSVELLEHQHQTLLQLLATAFALLTVLVLAGS
jgi:hypothetical protein